MTSRPVQVVANGSISPLLTHLPLPDASVFWGPPSPFDPSPLARPSALPALPALYIVARGLAARPLHASVIYSPLGVRSRAACFEKPWMPAGIRPQPPENSSVTPDSDGFPPRMTAAPNPLRFLVSQTHSRCGPGCGLSALCTVGGPAGTQTLPVRTSRIHPHPRPPLLASSVFDLILQR